MRPTGKRASLPSTASEGRGPMSMTKLALRCSCAIAISILQLDVAVLHELLHAVDLLADLRLELGGRVAHGARADLLDVGAEGRVGLHLLHGLSQALDDLGRRLGGRQQAV